MKTQPVQLIVGLGNPGPEYSNTRHNAGEDFVRALAQKHNIPLSANPKHFGLLGRGIVAQQDIRLLIPTTFMNRSGQAVASVAQFFKIPLEAVLVAHDELDLPPGTARLKKGGGHGGHNGLRDIISQNANNREFGRLRIGIGHPGNAKQVASFVLKKAPAQEFEQTERASEKALDLIDDIVTGDWDKAMRQLHTN